MSDLEERAYARGFRDAREKAKVEGRFVIVDSPELAALRARVKELEAENFALVVQQCLFSDGSGLCGDEWGHQYCAMKRRAEAAEAKLANRATIEIRPASDILAFGAYIAPVGDFTSPAKIAINFAACIGAVAAGDLKPADVPAVVLQTIWHEIGHAIEHWAGVEFSEDRVEALAMQLAPTGEALR